MKTKLQTIIAQILGQCSIRYKGVQKGYIGTRLLSAR